MTASAAAGAEERLDPPARGYPHDRRREPRPRDGAAYRLISEGPGVTRDAVRQGSGVHPFDTTNAADARLEARTSAEPASIRGPDKICPPGHALKGVTPAAVPRLASVGALPGPGSG